MTIDEFEKRVAETITDTKPAKVAGGKERAMTDLDKKLAPHLYGLREAGYDYVVYVMQSIKSLIKEEMAKARIETAEHIQNTMVSPTGGYCDEISPSAIPDYIAELKKEIEKPE